VSGKVLNLLYKLFAILFVGLGLVGVLVPGLPTVPFILLAAWCGSKGSPRLEAWLLAHPHFGPHIRNWRDNRSIPRRAKYLSSIFMSVSAIILWFANAIIAVKVAVPCMLILVAIWIWRLDESDTIFANKSPKKDASE